MSTHSGYVKKAIAATNLNDYHYMDFTAEDYRNYSKINPFNIIGKKFEASHCISLKAQSLTEKNYDIIYMNAVDFAFGLSQYTSKAKTILALDTTDFLSHRLLHQKSPTKINYLKQKAKELITNQFYRKAFANIDIFMPLTQWCADSLIDDYGISKDRIIISAGGIDTKLWKRQRNDGENSKPNLLFVGNDFFRKGGYFLLEIFEKYLSELCNLLIVSNDPLLNKNTMPCGAKLIKGINGKNIEKLIDVYNSSDIFTFPTYSEKLGWVLAEAASMHLPLVARDCGGISTIVKDGFNGYLMSYNSGHAEWTEAILKLINNKTLLNEFGTNSRILAETQLSTDILVSDIRKAFRLIGQNI